ncbi:ArsR/SmtB family transcription factor [Marinibaculum pumilum]|uniref:ArsR/SmtB family transcription factor n=1 Tax=Marinibaculum pumilum TaxID=1766165 RepID=A0ABV7KXE1_9PROT
MDQLLAALKAAAEPTRLRILAICARAELTVSELTLVLGQSQPRVSRHLKLLCAAGLLTRHPEGAWVFYRLSDRLDGTDQQPGSALTQALVRLVPTDDAVVQRDLARLEAVRHGRAEAAGEYFRSNAAHWSQIRSLYVDEAEVERALKEMVGGADLGDFLDVGTGTGRMLEIFGPGARRAVGFDMSREMLGYARSALEQAGLANCQVRLGDMYGLPLGAGSADTILYHQVLHFADDPAAAIAEGARLLRPGGRLIVVDFLPHDQEQLRDAHAHRRLGFAEQEVARWFRSVGLEPGESRNLPGKPLTVGIWTARAPAASAAATADDTDRPAADNAGGSVTYLSENKVREAAS